MRIGKEKLDIKSIINSSDEQKKEVIENRKKYDIDSYDLSNIICSMKDDNYKKHVVDLADEYDLRTRQIVDIVTHV